MTAPMNILERFSPAQDLAKAMEFLPGIFDEVLPSKSRRRQELRQGIRSLWEDLTSEREHRTAEYLGAPAYASAYIRYFLPWNILRLGHLLPSLPLSLPENPVLADLGSGPLTLPIALYISRPDLRKRPLTFYCADKTERILKIGRLIFESLCVRLSGSLPPWEIILLHESFGADLPRKTDLLTAANLFNEFFWKSRDPLAERAAATAASIARQLSERGQVFLMEPGDPRSGSFIAAIRTALLPHGLHPQAPCPHGRPCPMPGLAKGYLHGHDNSHDRDRSGFQRDRQPGQPQRQNQRQSPQADSPYSASMVLPKPRDKYPWCHFTVSKPKAPAWLQSLSDDAGLPKDKLVFSYLLSSRGAKDGAKGPDGAPAKDSTRSRDASPESRPTLPPTLRIVSEAFSLPGYRRGRYACSAEGYSLAAYAASAGTKPGVNAGAVNSGADPLLSGDLVEMPPAAGSLPSPSQGRRQAHTDEGKAPRKPREIDEKSGALVVPF